MSRRCSRVGRCVAVAAAVAPLGVAACGDDSKSDKAATKPAPTPLAITTSDVASKRFKTVAPKSIKGGLVKLTLTNASKKDEHAAQLLSVKGAHTSKELLKLFSREDAPIPDWVGLAGGTGTIGPGQTVSATLNLPAGKYVMFDFGGGDGPSASSRGAFAEFEVTAGQNGALPASSATITASTDEQGEPENSFEVSGGLKVGKNQVRLVTKGEQPHHAVLFPILPGKKLADVKQAFMQQGRPSGPPPVDFEGAVNTSTLDGDLEQVTDIQLRKPGKYVMVCFLKDRDGRGKPHLAEGMLKEVDVK